MHVRRQSLDVSPHVAETLAWIAEHDAKPGIRRLAREALGSVSRRHAGICYWKVDWGAHAADWAFRRMLTEVGRECQPELLIEHSNPSTGPLNGITVARDGTVVSRAAGRPSSRRWTR